MGVGVLVLIPEINAYWKEVLLAWRRHQPDLQVRVGAIVPFPTEGEEPWLGQLGCRPRPSMYYTSLRQRYPTPWWPLLVQLRKLRPGHLVCYGFSGWSLLACLWRRLGQCSRLTLLWEGSTPGVDLTHDRLRQGLRRWMLGCADDACSQSRAGAEYLAGLRPLPIAVRPWLCVDPAVIAPRRRSPASKPLRFLFVGSVEERKGIDFLFQVVSELPGDWELSLIGPVADHFPLSSDPRIRLLGPLPPGRLRQSLADHDVFLFPSREDTWGVAPIEAAAAGLTVVVSTYTPSAGLRPHWRCLPLQVALWRQALGELLNRPQQLEEQGARARQFESELYARAGPPWLAGTE